MLKRQLTYKHQINNNSINAILKVKIQSFLITITLERNILNVLNLSILKEIVHLLTLFQLPLLFLIEFVNRVKEKIPLMCHLKHPFFVINSSILNAKEDSSQEPLIMPNYMDLLILLAHLTTLLRKILLKSVLKNLEIVKESTLETTVWPLNHRISN